MVGLRNRSIRATAWSGADIFFQKGVNFITTMVLARLLTPGDYGIIEMLAIFLGLSTAFIDSGLSLALIQRREISDLDISSVFYFNIGMGLLFFGLFWVASPWVASFYRMPTLTPLARLVGAGLFMGSFGSVPKALYAKALDYKRTFILNTISATAACCVALWLAWAGYGVWSLAVQMVVAGTASSLLFLAFSPRRPRLAFSMGSLRSLSGFGVFVLFGVLVDVLYTRLTTLVIGRRYSARDLGYYSRADQTQRFPGGLLLMVIGRVAFPVFAAAQEDKAIVRAGLRKALVLVMMLAFPAMFGLMASAERMITVLFGPQWIASVPYFKVLCLTGCFMPLQELNANVLLAQGYSKLYLRVNAITKIIGIVLLIIACFFGIIIIAWSVVAAGVINYLISTYYTQKQLDYGAAQQIWDILPFLFGAGIMAASVWATGFVPLQIPLLLLAIQIMVGIMVYGAYCYFLHLGAFIELLEIARGYLRVKG